MNKFYITTAIPYVNAKPHIGHALEYVQSDCIARHHRQLGLHVLLLSGGDENAVKNVQAAEATGVPVQEFVDKNAVLFQKLAEKLNVTFDVFQKGSDTEKHFKACQKLWDSCKKNGDIYEKEYEGLYCVGCEAFYTRGELDENGECPEHPGKKVEKISEKNYFFRLSKYQDQLIDLISSDKLAIIPETRKNEVLSFLKEPLQDISISRTNERAKNWGVPVPDDPSQRIYVWFDALNIYQSGIGFGWDDEKYSEWWPADIHVLGKGIIRFHAVYWPAFLMSAGLELPKKLFVHGYVTADGEKMSKTVGNVIDPCEIIDKYGTDALRYYLLKEIPSYGDGDFSERRFIEVYNADLANGLGNLIARVAKLAERHGVRYDEAKVVRGDLQKKVYADLDIFRFNYALEKIREAISNVDKYLNIEKPWEQEPEKAVQTIENVIFGEGDQRSEISGENNNQLRCHSLLEIAEALAPFMPETSEKMLKQFTQKSISAEMPYFKRI